MMYSVRILRQDAPSESPYWANFRIEAEPEETVIQVLKKIQRSPVTEDGRTVAPVVWECNCLEEVCGGCIMLVGNVPMAACSAILGDVAKKQEADHIIELKPLTRYPVLRDLMVDRSSLFQNYTSMSLFPAEKNRGYKTKWAKLYPYTQCMACGVCVEACPNTAPSKNKNAAGKKGFAGMAHISRLRLMEEHDGMNERIFAQMRNGGIAECSGHGLCAVYCPKKIDLLAAIGMVNRACNKRMFKR